MSKLAPVSATQDHTQGPLNAGIVLIEYGDFECPYCGEAYPELKAVKEEMKDALCFVFRHFPLREMHPHAERAAEFAEAAATIGKFWEMHDMLYENQQALTDRDLTSYAKRLGLNSKLIESALGGQFSNEAAQREIPSSAALDQPKAMFARERLRPVTTHLTGVDVPFLTKLADPADYRAWRQAKPARRRLATHPLLLNCRYRPLAKIQRIRPCHSCWPPSQPAS